jgi:hypothetical protein
VEQTLAVLLPAPLACCRFELKQRHMTPPSNFALRIIVEEDPKLVRSLNFRYADAASDGGLLSTRRNKLPQQSTKYQFGDLKSISQS